MLSRRSLTVISVMVLLLAGCAATTSDDAPPEPVRLDWRSVSLPVPAGPAGRLVLRDAAACAGRWYVVGAVADPAGGTRPAAWTSADGASWTSLPIAAKSYYGRQNVLYSAACREGRVAALGAKSGGAHGNPRTSSWRHLPDGTLSEVTAPFELYGGPRAVNVARMVAGPRGFLIAGNRTGGAASWVSADSARFRIVEGAPELASDARGETWGFDAVDTDAGWLTVGGIVPAGRTDRDPLAWSSTDGVAWQRVPVPGTDGYDELQRVVLLDGVPVAVGLRGRAFGAWRGGPEGWRSAGGFGVARAEGVPAVRGLTVGGGQLFAATTTGAEHALWVSADGGTSWRAVTAPRPLPAGAEQTLSLLGVTDQLLILAEDGTGGELLVARVGKP